MRMEAIAIKPAANARERLSRNLPTPPTAQPRSMAGINVGYHESCRAARSVPRIRHVVGDKAGIQVACGGRRLAVKLLGRKILKILGSLGEARVVGGRNGACDPRHGTARPPRRNSSGRVRVGLASGARIVQGIGNALPHDLAVVGIHDLRGYLVVVGIRSGRGCVLENPGLIIPPRVGKARVAVEGQVTGSFGERIDPFNGEGAFHSGVDISSPYGHPIIAPADGVVTFADFMGGYGKAIMLDHGHGISTRYGHLSGFSVTTGEHIHRGDVIGYVGLSGRSTGPHLHYEVRINDTPVNPYKYLRMTVAHSGGFQNGG